MSVTIYHNPRCSKSRAALELLRGRGADPEIIEYLEAPPTEQELRRILKLLGMNPRDLLRSREAKEAGLDERLPDEALLAAMVANPILIERPIVISAKGARLGRPPERVLEIL